MNTGILHTPGSLREVPPVDPISAAIVDGDSTLHLHKCIWPRHPWMAAAWNLEVQVQIAGSSFKVQEAWTYFVRSPDAYQAAFQEAMQADDRAWLQRFHPALCNAAQQDTPDVHVAQEHLVRLTGTQLLGALLGSNLEALRQRGGDPDQFRKEWYTIMGVLLFDTDRLLVSPIQVVR